MLGISDKVAVVTGATSGLGKAMAFELARFGAKVALAARGEEAGAETLGELREEVTEECFFHRTDVSSYDDVESLIDATLARFERVDFMVNNAGVFLGGPPHEMAIDDWNRVIDVNLNGVYYGSRAAARPMIDQGGGRIVNVSSIIGVTGKLLCSAYTASKGAVNALTKNLAIDLADNGILVNAVVPGVCDSEINAHLPDDERRRSEVKIPLNRWGQPGEIAKSVVYLCSDLSTYVTGETLVVDGGYLAGKEVRAGDSVL